MAKLNLLNFIGEPAAEVKSALEKDGYEVEIVVNSKPKIKTDSVLVVSLRQEGNKVTLIVGDFLIGVKNELV